MPNVDKKPYYNLYPIETVDMMIAVFGKEAVRNFCLVNAFKYRLRLGYKNSIEEDLAKEKWYLNKANELNGNTN